jgi:hypothetical protein
MQRIGHARPTNAEHQGQEVVREGKVLANSVLAHENPSGESLLDVVSAVGQGGGGDLD